MIKLLSRQALEAICHPFCSPLLNPLRGPLRTRHLRPTRGLPSYATPAQRSSSISNPSPIRLFARRGGTLFLGYEAVIDLLSWPKVWRSRAGSGAELDPCLARVRRGAESGIKRDNMCQGRTTKTCVEPKRPGVRNKTSLTVRRISRRHLLPPMQGSPTTKYPFL
jgi:hypothetical protein